MLCGLQPLEQKRRVQVRLSYGEHECPCLEWRQAARFGPEEEPECQLEVQVRHRNHLAAAEEEEEEKGSCQTRLAEVAEEGAGVHYLPQAVVVEGEGEGEVQLLPDDLAVAVEAREAQPADGVARKEVQECGSVEEVVPQEVQGP